MTLYTYIYIYYSNSHSNSQPAARDAQDPQMTWKENSRTLQRSGPGQGLLTVRWASCTPWHVEEHDLEPLDREGFNQEPTVDLVRLTNRFGELLESCQWALFLGGARTWHCSMSLHAFRFESVVSVWRTRMSRMSGVREPCLKTVVILWSLFH